MASIENTERLVDRFNDAALADIDKFNKVREVWMKNKDLVNMIHFQQAWHHGIMIKIALLINSSINNVKDRETLYLRFINVLIAVNRLDVSAALRGGVHAIVEKVKIVNRQSHPGRSKTANYIIHFSSKIKEIESDLEKMWQNKPKEKEQKLPHPIIVKAFKDG